MSNEINDLVFRTEGTANPADDNHDSVDRIYQEVFLPAVEAYRKVLESPSIDPMDQTVELAVVYASTSSGRRKRKAKRGGATVSFIPPTFHELWVGTLMSASSPNRASTATLHLSSRGRTIKIDHQRVAIETPNLEAHFSRSWKYTSEGAVGMWSLTRVRRFESFATTMLPAGARTAYTQLMLYVLKRGTDRNDLTPAETPAFRVMSNIMQLCEKNRYQGLKSPDPHPSKRLLNAAAAAYRVLCAEAGIFGLVGGYSHLGVADYRDYDDLIVSQFATMMVWFGIDTIFTNALASGAFHARNHGLTIDLYQSDMYLFELIRDQIPKVYKQFVD